MRILVTGGAGFIGSFLVEKLLSNGYSVSILDNIEAQVHPFGTPAHLASAANFYLGNILDRDILTRALKDIDVVVHCAATVGIAQHRQAWLRSSGSAWLRCFHGRRRRDCYG